MGRVKTTLVKRTSKELIIQSKSKGDLTPSDFTGDFERNKKVLGNNTMPSKRMRNMIAGYISRLQKRSEKILSK